MKINLKSKLVKESNKTENGVQKNIINKIVDEWKMILNWIDRKHPLQLTKTYEDQEPGVHDGPSSGHCLKLMPLCYKTVPDIWEDMLSTL